MKRTAIFFLLGCVSFVAISVAFPTAALAQAANPDFARAQELFHQKKWTDAIAVLDPYLATHPTDERGLVLRGDCKAELGQNAEALKDYNRALEINPNYEYGYVTRCETRLQLDDVEGSLSDCNNAVRLNPNDAKAYEDRADAYFQRSAYQLALNDYEKAVALGGSSAYLFGARCDSKRLVGRLDDARADCDKALLLDPRNRRALWARGRLALVQVRYADGIADLNSYIGQKPQSSDTAYYFRGLAYNRLNSYQLALNDLQIYVQRQPGDPDGYRERALALNGMGDKKAALADLDSALQGYRKQGNSAAADRVSSMIADIVAGRQPVP
jgi:tetratricopeptide (TPR) repeat protein